jgi:hypothetical protein
VECAGEEFKVFVNTVVCCGNKWCCFCPHDVSSVFLHEHWQLNPTKQCTMLLDIPAGTHCPLSNSSQAFRFFTSMCPKDATPMSRTVWRTWSTFWVQPQRWCACLRCHAVLNRIQFPMMFWWIK